MEHPQAYERMVELHEQDQLAYYTQRSTNAQTQDEISKLFINLSIKQILEGISRTFVEIIDELLSGKINGPIELVVSLFQADRMVYVGTLFVIIAFAIYIVDITG